MSIPRRQRQLMFQRERRDPDVVFRDGGAGFGQLCPEPAVVVRGCHAGRDHSNRGKEGRDTTCAGKFSRVKSGLSRRKLKPACRSRRFTISSACSFWLGVAVDHAVQCR